MNSKMREIMETSWREWNGSENVGLSYEHGFDAACDALIPLLKQSYPHVYGNAGADHLVQGFRPSRLPIDDLVDSIKAVTE